MKTLSTTSRSWPLKRSTTRRSSSLAGRSRTQTRLPRSLSFVPERCRPASLPSGPWSCERWRTSPPSSCSRQVCQIIIIKKKRGGGEGKKKEARERGRGPLVRVLRTGPRDWIDVPTLLKPNSLPIILLLFFFFFFFFLFFSSLPPSCAKKKLSSGSFLTLELFVPPKEEPKKPKEEIKSESSESESDEDTSTDLFGTGRFGSEDGSFPAQAQRKATLKKKLPKKGAMPPPPAVPGSMGSFGPMPGMPPRTLSNYSITMDIRVCRRRHHHQKKKTEKRKKERGGK